MRLIKAIACFFFLLVLVALPAIEARAERPQTREIRDKIRWGDPDEPAGCRGPLEWQKSVLEMPEDEMAIIGIVIWPEVLQEKKAARENFAPVGFGARVPAHTACRKPAMRR